MQNPGVLGSDAVLLGRFLAFQKTCCLHLQGHNVYEECSNYWFQ